MIWSPPHVVCTWCRDTRDSSVVDEAAQRLACLGDLVQLETRGDTILAGPVSLAVDAVSAGGGASFCHREDQNQCSQRQNAGDLRCAGARRARDGTCSVLLKSRLPELVWHNCVCRARFQERRLRLSFFYLLTACCISTRTHD